MSRRPGYPGYVLGVLVVVYTLNFLDRQIVTILAEEIKRDLGVSDAQIGFLYGTAFAVFYALFGIPLGRLADLWTRRTLIALGLATWSLMTALSGLALGLAFLGINGLTAAMIVVTLAFTGWNFAIDTSEGYGGEFGDTAAVIRMSLAINAPVLLAGLGAWMGGKSLRAAFWIRLEQLALTYGVGLASLVIVVSAFERLPAEEEAGRIFLGLAAGSLVGLVAAALVWFARTSRSGEAQAGVLLGASLSVLPAFFLSDSQALAGVLFMALWAGIAAAALYAGWRGVFQIAVGVISLRLIILSFELGGDLLLSGVGLIVSGLLILAIAFAAVRVSKRFAPDAGEAA